MISEKYKNDKGRQGHTYINEFTSFGFTSVDILPNLIGKPWDDVALGFVHGMNPTHIRVIDGRGEQLDAETGRVTIHLNSKTKLIESIEQEIRVGLPEGIPHGQGLAIALEFGIEPLRLKGDDSAGYIYCPHIPEGVLKKSGEARTKPNEVLDYAIETVYIVNNIRKIEGD